METLGVRLDHGTHMMQQGAFAPTYLAELETAILTSPLLGKNPLNQYFATTQGFSVVFRREGMADVIERFPAFAPYLVTALSPMANAFYLNPLVLPPGARVMRHADFSLRSYDPTTEPPAFVSVLYVQVPEDLEGGRLRLFQADDSCIAEVTPQEGTLLYFRGDLRHDVTEVAAGSARISLVCEQYCLSPEALNQVPRLTVQTTAGFGALLALETDLGS